MAHTPGFDYDIFVSFAHRDDEPPPGPGARGPGWVREFVDYLAWWLRCKRGFGNLEVWFDRQRLTGATEYDQRIQHDLGRSALLVVVQSHHYHRSTYCRQELDWFIAKAKTLPTPGLAVDGERRILNVLINQLPHQAARAEPPWIDALAGVGGCRFHDDYGDPIPYGNRDAFDTAMREVVNSADKVLKALARHALPEVDPTGRAPAADGTDDDPRPALFVAYVTDSLDEPGRKIIGAVRDKVRLLDPVPPPGSQDAHDAVVRKRLGSADLSLHLLGEHPGKKLEDTEETYLRRLCDLARASGQRALIWMPDGLDLTRVADATHRAWLDAMERADRPAEGWRVARGSDIKLIEDLCELVDALAARRAEQGAGACALVIDQRACDQRYGFQLADCLCQREPTLPVRFTRDGDEAPARWDDFGQLLRQAQGLVVLCGRAPPAWVRARVEHAVKIGVLDTQRPVLERIWVVQLPECREPLSLPRLPGPRPRLRLLDNAATPTFAPVTIDKLLGIDAEAQ